MLLPRPDPQLVRTRSATTPERERTGFTNTPPPRDVPASCRYGCTISWISGQWAARSAQIEGRAERGEGRAERASQLFSLSLLPLASDSSQSVRSGPRPAVIAWDINGARRRAAQCSPGLCPGKPDYGEIERPRRRPPQRSNAPRRCSGRLRGRLEIVRFDSPGSAQRAEPGAMLYRAPSRAFFAISPSRASMLIASQPAAGGP
jgi:hypothetical protein